MVQRSGSARGLWGRQKGFRKASGRVSLLVSRWVSELGSSRLASAWSVPGLVLGWSQMARASASGYQEGDSVWLVQMWVRHELLE